MRSISFLGRRSPSAPQMELDAREESFYYRARFDLFVHAFAHGLKPLSRQKQTLEVGKSKEWRNPRVNIPHGICLSFNSSLGNTCRFRGSAQRSSSLFALRSSSRLNRPMVLSSCAGASAEALIPAPCKQRREETQCNQWALGLKIPQLLESRCLFIGRLASSGRKSWAKSSLVGS